MLYCICQDFLCVGDGGSIHVYVFVLVCKYSVHLYIYVGV